MSLSYMKKQHNIKDLHEKAFGNQIHVIKFSKAIGQMELETF